MGPAESDGGKIDVKELFKQANRPKRMLANQARQPESNEVHALLRDNLERANAAGLNDVGVPRRRLSRRKRDYFLILIPVDIFFALLAWRGGNPMTFAYGVGGFMIFSLGLTWLMWFVMEDY